VDEGRVALSVERAGAGATVVAAAGDVDLATVPELERVLQPEVETGGRVVLDLSGCTFIDSSGLRALVRARDVAAEAGGSLAVAVPPGPLTRVFEVAGLHDALELHSTRAEALSA
jgi:anti-sigma B factor antagonist